MRARYWGCLVCAVPQLSLASMRILKGTTVDLLPAENASHVLLQVPSLGLPGLGLLIFCMPFMKLSQLSRLLQLADINLSQDSTNLFRRHFQKSCWHLPGSRTAIKFTIACKKVKNVASTLMQTILYSARSFYLMSRACHSSFLSIVSGSFLEDTMGISNYRLFPPFQSSKRQWQNCASPGGSRMWLVERPLSSRLCHSCSWKLSPQVRLAIHFCWSKLKTCPFFDIIYANSFGDMEDCKEQWLDGGSG